MFHMYKPADDKAWAVYNATDGKWRGYLTDSAGHMYIDGSYYTFSPKVPDADVELVEVIKKEIYKPEVSKNDKGQIICPICGKNWVECPREHTKYIEENYGKDIGLVALASGKLITMLYDKIRRLEEKIVKFEKRIGGG